jgi:hypothetical protein
MKEEIEGMKAEVEAQGNALRLVGEYTYTPL